MKYLSILIVRPASCTSSQSQSVVQGRSQGLKHSTNVSQFQRFSWVQWWRQYEEYKTTEKNWNKPPGLGLGLGGDAELTWIKYPDQDGSLSPSGRGQPAGPAVARKPSEPTRLTKMIIIESSDLTSLFPTLTANPPTWLVLTAPSPQWLTATLTGTPTAWAVSVSGAAARKWRTAPMRN